IRAPRSVSFISESLTEAERSKAEAAVPKQVTTDPTILANAAARIQSAVTAIGRIRTDAAQQRDQKIAALVRLPDVALTAAIATDVVDMTHPGGGPCGVILDGARRT